LIGNCFWLTFAWWAIVKEVWTWPLPAEVVTVALTVTRSPGEKEWAGRKLSPVPVE
jgi:hypothetical protein